MKKLLRKISLDIFTKKKANLSLNSPKNLSFKKHSIVLVHPVYALVDFAVF